MNGKKVSSLEQVTHLIYSIGDKQRSIEIIKNRLERYIEQEKERASKEIDKLQEIIENMVDAIYQYSVKNRKELTSDDRRKVLRVLSGTFGWRKTQSKVHIDDIDKVVKVIKERNLDQFLRIKTEVNKMAMRQDPDTAKEIPGISISQVETFFVKPSETDVKVVRIVKVFPLKQKRKRPAK